MKLESQVTSLEISKRLKELGVKQESLFYWDTLAHYPPRLTQHPNALLANHGVNKETYSAFTVAELGELLSINCSSYKDIDRVWCCLFSREEINFIAHREYAETEADARGKMLIYLIENKFVP